MELTSHTPQQEQEDLCFLKDYWTTISWGEAPVSPHPPSPKAHFPLASLLFWPLGRRQL